MTTSNRVRIKEEAGWLVAGVGFARALEMLSDGAFRLFAWLSINAHRRSSAKTDPWLISFNSGSDRPTNELLAQKSSHQPGQKKREDDDD
jgi:hypothetical protein